MPSLQQYINAGVLLFHLKQLRNDGMNQVFLEELEKDHPYEDQDILNLCCYDRILHLPAKWNLFTVFMGQTDKLRKAGIEEPVIDAFRKKSGIIHYATPLIRPWVRTNTWASNLWWRTAEAWSNESVFEELKEKVCNKEQKDKWKYYVERCSVYNKVVVFGFTGCGRELCDWVSRTGLAQVTAICDNDPQKQGMQYNGISVCSMQEILQKNTERKRESELFLIASQAKAEEIRDLLIEQEFIESDRGL